MYCKRRDRKSSKGPLTMNIGLHMLPSLEPLHIHIISDDFCSVHVKTKRQYNSFASDFFYKLDELVQSLKEIGDLAAEINPKLAQRQLDKELKCGKCGYGGGAMTEFKEHLETHL
jgi:aprataxin